MLIEKCKLVGLPKALVDYAEKSPKKAFSSFSIVNAHKSFKKVQQLKDRL